MTGVVLVGNFQGSERGAAEEGEVVELVGEGDLDVFGRKNSRGAQENDRKREQKSERENKWCVKHSLPSISFLQQKRDEEKCNEPKIPKGFLMTVCVC